MNSKKKYNVPVALVFFNRDKPFEKVFGAVRKAKPSKLFLIQDGPRKNHPEDKMGIARCREIAGNVDWSCEVFTNYSSVNMGCGMRMFSGISWAFEHVDRLAILEDDCVPNESFFFFCSEMLERYKDDTRIHEISGMNHLGIYTESPYSYIFSSRGSCWGWATWKRAWQSMDYQMKFMEDEYVWKCMEVSIKPRKYIMDLKKLGEKRVNELRQGKKLTAWTYQNGMARFMNSQLIIVPCKNLISNIGLTNDSSHAVNTIKKIPKNLQKVFFAETYTLDFPLNHPPYVIEDYCYACKVDKIMGDKGMEKWFRRIESIIRQVVYGTNSERVSLMKKITKFRPK